MNSMFPHTRATYRRVVAILLSVAFAAAGGSSVMTHSATGQSASDAIRSSKRMPDGNQWTTANLNVNAEPSYCYDNAEQNCRRYGRLYTWESARRACQSLGDGWRLPANDEWMRMAKAYGGVRDDAVDNGKAAFNALVMGGSSGFDAVLGGGRSQVGEFTRLDAHGFYWTASESSPASAWFYNLGRGGRILNRHNDGEKLRALSVRCVKS
jgi:uncharacterized protein (TIGR02145 family)